MFWNDPMLYGATLPYKDIPMQTPFMGTLPPWQTLPRFFPQTFGYTPYQTMIPPYLHTAVNPFVPPYAQTYAQPFQFQPYTQPFQFQPYTQPFQFQPYTQPFQLNLPFQNWQRPIVY